MQREVDSMKIEFDLQRQRLVLAQQAQTQFESLRADNFVSSAQVRTKAVGTTIETLVRKQ